METTTLVIDRAIHQRMKVLAAQEQVTIQELAGQFLRAGLEGKAAKAAHAREND